MWVGHNPPIHFTKDGRTVGISVDILSKISERFGFTVEYITDMHLPEALERLRSLGYVR